MKTKYRREKSRTLRQAEALKAINLTGEALERLIAEGPVTRPARGIGGAGHGSVRLWLSPAVRRILAAEREAPTRGPRTGRRDRAEPLAACGRWRDMQDADLLVGLAGIAGVFVGFGALISTRDGGASELWLIRNVVNEGLMVVAAALVPVVIGRYGITGHELWSMCSLIILVLDWAWIILMHTRREHMALQVIQTRATRAAISLSALFMEVPFQVALILVVLGPFPDVEPALYLTAVVLGVFQAAVLLVMLVYSQGRPATA